MKKLFTCLYGSSLYGTQTPTSDLDIKHIVLPSLGSLLVGRKPENEVHKTNNEKNTRNSAADVDEELIPIQVFARDFFKGQTYALELAFALDGTHAQQRIFDTRGPVVRGFNSLTQVPVSDRAYVFKTPMIVDFINELRTSFLTSNIKAMMGYVVNQANMYSLKGERLNLLNELKALFDKMLDYWNVAESTKLERLMGPVSVDVSVMPSSDFDSYVYFHQSIDVLAIKYPTYMKVTEYDIGGGRMRPCMIANGKTFPFTNTLGHSKQMLTEMMSKYGSRAEQAREMNVDWKAMMHALRIVDEGLKLLESKRLSFPFPMNDVDFYLSVKRGEVPIDTVRELLGSKLELLKVLEQTTSLPASTDPGLQKQFDAWLEGWMFKFYGVLKPCACDD